MFEKSLFRSAAALAALMLLISTAQAVTIDTVPVGNAGNAADTSQTFGLGSVAYDYRIGKYEVTVGQYTEFLNAVAADDTYGLYSADMMSSDPGFMIERSGSSGGYSYSALDNAVDRPVTHVSWGDGLRFANWLHNDQPTGSQDLTTTEDGAYYLNGATSNAALLAVSREADWKWAMPTVNEWVKAGYHDKSAGIAEAYFNYPTSSNIFPGRDMTETTKPGNNANYGTPVPIDWPYKTTRVGEFELSASPYGTFDQGGNAFEWSISGNETMVRGGTYGGSYWYLGINNRSEATPTGESRKVGFRVVSIPEPGTITLLVCASMAGLIWWRRRK